MNNDYERFLHLISFLLILIAVAVPLIEFVNQKLMTNDVSGVLNGRLGVLVFCPARERPFPSSQVLALDCPSSAERGMLEFLTQTHLHLLHALV